MPTVKSILPSVQAGSIPPEISAYTLEGKEVNLNDYKGKIIMLVFWKTWCEACKQELQEIRYLQEKYINDLIIFAVNMGEPKDTVRFYKRRLKINCPVLIDPDLIISTNYGIVAWPTTILINKKGFVHWTGVGLETEEINKEIESLLKS